MLLLEAMRISLLYFVITECCLFHMQTFIVHEFICYQSPQCMKNILFGLLYSIRAFNQLLANSTLSIFNTLWKESNDTCNCHLNMQNIGIAVLLLMMFTVVSYNIDIAKEMTYVTSNPAHPKHFFRNCAGIRNCTDSHEIS